MHYKRYACELDEGILYELVIKETGCSYPFKVLEELIAYMRNGDHGLEERDFLIFKVRRERIKS